MGAYNLRQLEKLREVTILDTDALKQKHAAPATSAPAVEEQDISGSAARLAAAIGVAALCLLTYAVFEQVLTYLRIPAEYFSASSAVSSAIGGLAFPFGVAIMCGAVAVKFRSRVAATALLMWAGANALFMTTYLADTMPLTRMPSVALCWIAVLAALVAVREVFQLQGGRDAPVVVAA